MNKIHNKELALDGIRVHHCASICPHKDGVLICFYGGTNECAVDQTVFVVYYDGKEYSKPLIVGYGSGNPVIWDISDNGSKAALLYSKFEKETAKPVQKWMYCSNWVEEITVQDDGYIRRRKLEPVRERGNKVSIGLLGRCQPIKERNNWILPLYREHNCYGLIGVVGSNLSVMTYGTIGKDDTPTGNRFGSGLLIQPTLWSDGEKVYSLSRDITRNKMAWYSESKDMNQWSKPETTNITNHNNSIVALHDGTKYPKIIWNNCDAESQQIAIKKFGRENLRGSRFCLMLGQLKEGMTVTPIEMLNEYPNASYPNYCFEGDDKLHLIHTDGRRIRHHIYEL